MKKKIKKIKQKAGVVVINSFTAKEWYIVHKCWKKFKFGERARELRTQLVEESRIMSIKKLRNKIFIEENKSRPSKVLMKVFKDRIISYSNELGIPPVFSGLEPNRYEESRVLNSTKKKQKSTATFCRCIKGKCDSCVCKVAGRRCNSRCHDKKPNLNCRLDHVESN